MTSNAFSAVVSLAAELAVSVIAPNACAACDEKIRLFTAFCPTCAVTLVRASLSDEPFAAFVYGGALSVAIGRFKYEQRPDLARPLAELLKRASVALLADPPDVVVPVPLHQARLVSRGFNQSALLARPIARQLGARFFPLALERVRDTTSQVAKGREARASNMEGAFRARARLRGLSVLLIDDVWTTGATARACTAALASAGASHVRTAVLAHAEREGQA